MSAHSPTVRAATIPPRNAEEENRRLRRTMRDLVALSTLPAVWSGLGLERVAQSLADVLLATLSLESAYVRLAGRTKSDGVEVVRGRLHDAGQHETAKAAFASLVDSHEQSAEPRSIIDRFGTTLRIAVVRFGVSPDTGALLACSARADFPTEQERLLLGVGANQLATVVQRRHAEEAIRDQREWHRVTLSSIDDAVIATDIDGKVTLLNTAAEHLTGWTQREAQAKPLDMVFRILDERSGSRLESPVARVLREGRLVGLANPSVLIAKDGAERLVDDSAAPIRDAAGITVGIVIVFRAATQRKAERHRSARLALTQTLNQAVTVDEAAAGVLRAIGENLGWDAGFFWLSSQDRNRLECRGWWHQPDFASSDFSTSTSVRTFERGEGLPGRVWQSQTSVWIPDLTQDSDFRRLAAASSAGLRCAFACPVMVGARAIGVIEFFTRRVREPDPDLLEMMGSAIGNVGQFIERKAAEDELRRSEQELSEFFENATVGLHWVGPDGKVVRVNRAELELLGYTRDEYLGRHISEFHADEHVICDILDKLNAGERLVEYPARLRCKDGSVKDVLIDSSVLWSGGKFVHTRCFTRDVTQRRQAETALADARSRLDAALEAGAIATWTWDIPNNVLFADRKLSELFGLALPDGNSDVLDRYVEAIHPDDRARVIETLARAVDGGDPYDADYRIVQADGSIRWVTARGRAERDATGRAVRMPGVLVDITDRKLLEEALRNADRRKDEFLATLAHELRNPLAPIRYSLEILKMPRLDGATLEKTRAMMERQVHHLVRLVDDLLDVSRVMRGKIELRKEPIELAAVVARAVETVQPLVEVQGHTLELLVPNESLLLDADPVRLAQVVGNLLTNAAKYTEANGHIRISAEREGDHVVALRVRDNGIGIAAEMLPHIFELFMQVDHRSSKTQGGLGIGLTLARNLVEMHGGTLEPRSAGLGKGSEFIVRLPLLAQDGQAGSDAANGDPRAEASPSGHRLLVVDDNVDAATGLATLLRLQGHDVRVAHDGPAAIAAAADYLPHLILLDIGMPGMDGYEVASRLRLVPGLEHTVLAALTGWGQQEDCRRTAAAGFHHHLVKPLEPDVLAQLLVTV